MDTFNRAPVRKLIRSTEAGLAVLALAGCSKSVALVSQAQSSPKHSQPELCRSPRYVSQSFAADPHATSNRNTWTKGINLNVHMPKDSEGIVVGYTNPGGHEWHDSDIVPKNLVDHKIALKLGSGAVTFSTEIVAESGTAICNQIPDANFTETNSFARLMRQGETAPTWISK